MPHSLQVETSANAIRRLWEKHGIKKPFRFLGFCLSLLPIPVISQVGVVLDRHLSDKALEEHLIQIYSKIETLNESVSKIVHLEDAIAEIAKTVGNNERLKEDAREFIQKLGTYQKEFVSVTEKGSYQQVLNSLIEAEDVCFITRSGSTNLIDSTTVNAERTILHTSGGSVNFINKATFKGAQGAVSMQGVSTQGQITVKNSSMEFGPNSSMVFGGNPFLISGVCPRCNHPIKIDRRNLVGYTSIECQNCKGIFPFSLEE